MRKMHADTPCVAARVLYITARMTKWLFATAVSILLTVSIVLEVVIFPDLGGNTFAKIVGSVGKGRTALAKSFANNAIGSGGLCCVGHIFAFRVGEKIKNRKN